MDATRWGAVELQLRLLASDLVAGVATAADVNATAGLLGWISRVIPNASTFIRGLYLVVCLLRRRSSFVAGVCCPPNSDIRTLAHQ